MTTADTVGIVIAIVLALALVAGAFRVMADRREMRERFGDEYDAVVRETGGRAAAEGELRRRMRAHKRLELRGLTAEESAHYHEMWDAAQVRFVDDPSAAVRDADRVVAELVADRGYPVVDFGARTAQLSVAHSHVLADYRAGHDIAIRNDAGRATTEELRQALVHYRAVFTDLLADAEGNAPVADEPGIAPVPGEGGDVRALAQTSLPDETDEVAVYAPADPVLPAERIRYAEESADVGAPDAETAAAKDGAKRRVNGVRLGATPTTEGTDATSDAH